MADGVNMKNVWPYYSSTNSKTASENAKATLGQDEFLKILMTQLSSQDPMQPMQDTEFIAQMAQFTAVEQMTKVADEVKLLRQSSGISPELIDKKVTWPETASDGTLSEKSGVVSGIIIKKGLQYVMVNGKEISIDQITKVNKAEVKADE